MRNIERRIISKEIEDPQYESLNNFRFHMPGGMYRSDKEALSTKSKKLIEARISVYNEYIAKPEAERNEKECEFIKGIEDSNEIQSRLDTILFSNRELAERWRIFKKIIHTEGSLQKTREYVLRPIYVELRKEFSKEQLTT